MEPLRIGHYRESPPPECEVGKISGFKKVDMVDIAKALAVLASKLAYPALLRVYNYVVELTPLL